MYEIGGTGKLKSHWEPNLFEVVKVDENLPVYTLQNVNSKKDRRVLHRNLLMRSNDLPLELFEKETVSKLRKQKKQETVSVREEEVEHDGSQTDELSIKITYSGADSVNGRGYSDDIVETVEPDPVEKEGKTVNRNIGTVVMADLLDETGNTEEFEGFPDEEIDELPVENDSDNGDMNDADIEDRSGTGEESEDGNTDDRSEQRLRRSSRQQRQ